MKSIQVESVKKTYKNGTKALDEVNLEIEEGDFFGLVGENGAGKTTLINILTGQIKPDSGTLSVLGVDPVENLAESRSNVGILPEKKSPLDFLKVRSHLKFVADSRGMSEEDFEEKIKFWSEFLNMEDKMDKLNRDLSRGQQQKVMFASTFLSEPDLVYIDEPLVNLDPSMQEKLIDYLVEYNEEGNTIILSTHYMEAAYKMCKNIGVMDNGKIVSEHSTSELDSADDIRNILINYEQ